jgi:hypothetical protein
MFCWMDSRFFSPCSCSCLECCFTKSSDTVSDKCDLKTNKIEKRVSLDHTRPCISTSKKHKKKTGSYTCNSPSDPSLSVHRVVGTGSCTTSTTNMYNKHRFHVPEKDKH